MANHRKKWEYKIVFCPRNNETEDLFNGLGSDGWELITAQYIEADDGWYVQSIFKRLAAPLARENRGE